MELKNKGADAVIIDTIIAEIFANRPMGLKQSRWREPKKITVFCIEKGNTEITELINDGLAR